MLQRSKTQHENKAAGDAVSRGSVLPVEPGALRRAAIEAAKEGDRPLEQGRFRDADCFIAGTKSSRYEDEGFSVHRSGADDAMSSAVLDLMEDDTASGNRTFAQHELAAVTKGFLCPVPVFVSILGLQLNCEFDYLFGI